MPRASQTYDDAVATLRRMTHDPDSTDEERARARRALEAMDEDPDEGEGASALESRARAYASGASRVHPRASLAAVTVEAFRRRYYR